MRRRLVPLLVLPAAAGALLLSGPGASGQNDPYTRTLSFREGERGSTFTHIRNTPSAPQKANTQGDLLAFSQPLLAGDRRVGMVDASCVTTRGANDFRRSLTVCTAVVTLRDGTLMLQTPLRPDQDVEGAVTGGSGAYANARGTFSSADATTTITLY